MDCSVVQGDIADQSADALVNAAGTSLQMGSGVAGALRRAAGRGLGEEAVTRGASSWAKSQRPTGRQLQRVSTTQLGTR